MDEEDQFGEGGEFSDKTDGKQKPEGRGGGSLGVIREDRRQGVPDRGALRSSQTFRLL